MIARAVQTITMCEHVSFPYQSHQRTCWKGSVAMAADRLDDENVNKDNIITTFDMLNSGYLYSYVHTFMYIKSLGSIFMASMW